MLIRKTDLKSQELGVIPQDVHLVVDYYSNLFLLLELPAQDEIKEVTVSPPIFSLKELSENDKLGIKDSFLAEYEKELDKYERYKDSSNFLNKLSNLVELAGDTGLAEKYLIEASNVSEDNQFLRHEYGDILIDQGKFEAAEIVFNQCNFETDIYSNLRLAYIALKKERIDDVWKKINLAFDIDEFDCRASLFAGTMCLYSQKYENAIRYFRIAQEQFDRSSSLHVNMAFAYWMLQQPYKAEKSLSRAIQINPLNRNAVVFYADISLEVNEIDKSITALKYYLDYEQKSEVVWERLGRSYYNQGLQSGAVSSHVNSIEALKFQEALSPSPAIWSNIGLNYCVMKQDAKGRRFYAQAIVKAEEEKSPLASVVPMNNLCLSLVNKKEFSGLLEILREYLLKYGEQIQGHRLVDKLKLFSVIALEGDGKYSEAGRAIEQLLTQGIEDSEIRLDLLNRLLIHYVDVKPNVSRLTEIIMELSNCIDDSKVIQKDFQDRIINNISFAYCYLHDIDNAAIWISKISHIIHLDPFATATFGMLKILKGKIEEGKSLYMEASSKFINPSDKARCKQRMYYELAKKLATDGELSAAKSNLKLSLKARSGDDPVSQNVKNFSNSLHAKLIQ